VPLGHLGVSVPDLPAAKEYYDELMPLLGYEGFLATGEQFSYQPLEGKPGTRLFFYPTLESSDYSRHRTGLQHLAFMVMTRAAVDAVHAWVVARGGEVLHAPKEWPEYHEGYYATFWLDPHGFMLEAVCHRDQSQR
jgi:catechol 2,3-dioxygenase-like lactoylglutathione lyase family enzyme